MNEKLWWESLNYAQFISALKKVQRVSKLQFIHICTDWGLQATAISTIHKRICYKRRICLLLNEYEFYLCYATIQNILSNISKRIINEKTCFPTWNCLAHIFILILLELVFYWKEIIFLYWKTILTTADNDFASTVINEFKCTIYQGTIYQAIRNSLLATEHGT